MFTSPVFVCAPRDINLNFIKKRKKNIEEEEKRNLNRTGFISPKKNKEILSNFRHFSAKWTHQPALRASHNVAHLASHYNSTFNYATIFCSVNFPPVWNSQYYIFFVAVAVAGIHLVGVASLFSCFFFRFFILFYYLASPEMGPIHNFLLIFFVRATLSFLFIYIPGGCVFI